MAIHASHPSMCRQLVGGKLRVHYGVASQATELDGLGKLVGLVGARRTDQDGSQEEPAEGECRATLGGVVEIDARILRRLVGLLRGSSTPLPPRPKRNQQQSAEQEPRRHHVSQNSDIWIRVLGNEAEQDKQENVGHAYDGQSCAGHADWVAQQAAKPQNQLCFSSGGFVSCHCSSPAACLQPCSIPLDPPLRSLALLRPASSTDSKSKGCSAW